MLRTRAATSLVALAVACGGTSARPDLLLVTVDTLRPDRLACYGGHERVGLSLCGLAAQGTRFAWALSTAPSTAPSVASILTSRYPRDHRVVQLGRSALAPELVTVAEVLREGGYATAGFVANPVLRRQRGFDQGFEVYDDRVNRPERNRPHFLEREAEELTDAALRHARSAKRPWFLWVHYQDPHGPYDAPGSRAASDPPDSPRLAVLADHSGWRGIPAYQVLPGARSVAAYVERYEDEIVWLDRHLGRLIRELDARAPRPAVLLGADHGEAFGEDDFYFAHGHSVALDQIHVPLIWRPAAGGAAGSVITRPVSNLDIAPTLLAEAGLAAPEFAGIRLPAVENGAAANRVFFAEHALRIAVVAGPILLARDRHPFSRPVPDVVSGGVLPPLAPRMFRLARGGELAAAEDRGVRAALERRIEEFTAQSGGAEAPAAASELDEATREALHGLGYLQ